MPCVYLPGPAPAVTVANNLNYIQQHENRAAMVFIPYFYRFLDVKYVCIQYLFSSRNSSYFYMETHLGVSYFLFGRVLSTFCQFLIVTVQ